jgi:hypothetical protein
MRRQRTDFRRREPRAGDPLLEWRTSAERAKVSHELRENNMTPNNIEKPEIESEPSAARCAAVTGSGSFEILSGTLKITGLRWAANGKLQYCREQQYEQWEGGKPVAGGIRETWQDVESECPNDQDEPRGANTKNL